MSAVEGQVEMNVLVIDDEPDIRRSIGGYLKDIGHQAFLADCGEEGLNILKNKEIDIVITDVRMPGMDGFEVLKHVREESPNTEVVMVTAFGDISSAVRAIHGGAFDFFTKPVKLRDLTASLERTTRFHILRKEKDRYRERLDRVDYEVRQQYGLQAIIGDSPGMQRVKQLIWQVGQTNATSVLIYGETGTGKELVARAIQCEGARVKAPFVAVNCSAIPETLIESELYGHEKGAFTGAMGTHKGHFEAADGGTIFLDEIGDMDLKMQSRLLRTLEERCVRRLGGREEIPVDVRVISATNKNLPDAVTQGAFREDLFYRLSTFTIEIPPLRERLEDILPLARHFLGRYARETCKSIVGFTSQAETQLQAYAFPGNIRELKNIIERAVILCSERRIKPEHLLFATPSIRPSSNEFDTLDLAVVEERMIREAQRRSNGNKGKTAELLGLSRDALRRRMERYNI